MAGINGPVNLFRDEQKCNEDEGFVIKLADKHDFSAALKLNLPIVNRATSDIGIEEPLIPMIHFGNSVTLWSSSDDDELIEMLRKINAIANGTRSKEKMGITPVSNIGSMNEPVTAC